ncbi:uncharacterized short-chain type dehydrogenase/reductase y4vI-like [Oppia nitens]|uniref:uncharacterized short-chain type dehydrogenase/reductase y4vI-like n=1 Tax=Oppia nitens TaxID=1686743 RepID=UPI0023DBF74B|nr:uncharacterized short-chain type dehydrogenase/reductase y4vI-like [Oppia nitens]
MSVNYDFTGKVALITGSSSGIGAATAQLFAKSGANVVVTGRNADRVAKVAKQCTNVSPKQLTALEVVGDVNREVDLNRLIETTVQTFGKIDILVNNVGMAQGGDPTSADYYENFQSVMHTNLNSVVYLTHKCIPYLAKTRGNIINISSIASKVSFKGSSPYCMSKVALDMFTKCMAAELGPKHHIRVNSVNPGAVLTNFISANMGVSREINDKIFRTMAANYPVGRPGQPEDIAQTVAFLASDTAAGFLTGSIVVADGGHLAANVSSVDDMDKIQTVALITGSSSGIGAGIAELFAKSGANVVITGLDSDGVSKVAKQCTNVSPKQLPALEVVGDLTVEEDCNRLIDTTVQTFGKIDVLVNNAGINNSNTTDSYQNYLNIMSLNVNSVVYLTHKCVPYLAKTRGNVINISSVASKIAVVLLKESYAYCMSKAAVDMFTKCMAAELGPKHIRVNTINPGLVLTNIFVANTGISRESSDQLLSSIGNRYPVGRPGHVDDIANTVAYLASDAANFITGTCVVADGGQIAANIPFDSVTYDFTGKVALITGSSSGIGAATAQLFAKSGANVVVTGRNADRVAKVAKQCTDLSPKKLTALEVVGDVNKQVDCDRLIQTTVQTFGKIDILVNNVGFGGRADVTSVDFYQKFQNIMTTNLNSVVYLTHKSIEHLAKTNGNIINISSIAAKITGSGQSPYHMSKAALDMFTKCMAAELGPKRIRVNSVNPGSVNTSFVTNMGVPKPLSDKLYETVGAKYPVGRAGTADDIANTIVYLASDTAAGFLTGSIVVADGGHLAANVSFDGEKKDFINEMKQIKK